MRILALLWVTVAAACAPSVDAKTPDDYTVTLASVNLGNDCWTPPPAPPAGKFATPPAPVVPPITTPAPSSPMPRKTAPSTAGPSENVANQCDQTSMQILVKAAAGLKPVPVKVKKLELLDAKGKLIEELTARDAQRWEADKYVAWDQSVDANKSYQLMYPLTAPAWHKLPGGRMSAHERSFQLRVTLSIGAGAHTVDKQSIVPARLPPPVPT
jgi:hypothetical protein